ncbi:MAG: hypothetical protein VKQ33_09580 [Candidatus Sericytochromatia bacterium]|nr:hypothetical protein [Candidatus Sericytochromatia bacterium]
MSRAGLLAGLAPVVGLVILASPARAQLEPVPVATVLGQPLLDRESGALVVPYAGATPSYRLVWRSSREVELSFPGSSLRPAVPRGDRADGATPLTAWLAVPEDAGAPPRILLTVIGATDVRVFDDPARGRLLLVPKSIPGARPPLAPVAAPPAAAATVLEVGTAWASWAETYAAGDADTSVRGLPAVQVALSLPAPITAGMGPCLEARGRAFTAAFQDRLLPLSLHARTQLQVEAWGGWRLGGEAWRARLGGGGVGLFSQGQHSGAPPIPSYTFFTGRQVYGPLLAGSGTFALAGWLAGWRLSTELGWAPALLSTLDAGLPALPVLAWAAAEVGVERDLGPVRLRLGYRAQALYGPGFTETLMGPVLTLAGS